MAWLSLNGSALALATLIVTAFILLSGCGTISGMGKDISGAADWTKDKMTGPKNQSKEAAK
jgi:predicted small secreted protein